jgi:cystathionine beta-lyase/cystathionine gamma-synthase
MAAPCRKLDTLAVHAGSPRPRVQGAVVTPIFQSAMYEDDGAAVYHDIRYIRLNNTPNHIVVQTKLAALEGAEAAIVAASGMAAITTALLTVLSAGDHLLIQDSLYGGTHDFVTKDLGGFGIGFDFIDAEKPGTWEAKLTPTTRAIYVETISNPLMQVPDLEAVVAFARKHRLVSLTDNTFATPVGYRPIEHGFDISLHSCTKYLNGHSDIVAGAAVGSAALIERVKHKLDHLGGSLDPHACFLLERGMKTLGLRVRRQTENAQALAEFLAGHARVERVHYPGLPSHGAHDRAARLFDGMGGMLSFEPRGGVAAAARFMNAVTIPTVAPSLGGPETLVTRPALTSHSGMTREARLALGITDSLIRVSVGIEAGEDLVEDFGQALAKAG